MKTTHKAAAVAEAMPRRFACWDSKIADEILRPLALQGHESIFVATHSPIEGLIVGGTRGNEVTERTERGLLAALCPGSVRHAMCVVEGEAGSGKSHLIRWLKVHWSASDRDVVVLIERADGTLDGTLSQLKQVLAPGAGAALGAIVPERKLTEKGMQQTLLAQLATYSKSGMLENELPDVEWCERNGVRDLLSAPVVQERWTAPGNVLAILTKGEGRDSRVARFGARDVLELSSLSAGLRGKNVGPGAIMLAHELKREAGAVASAMEAAGPGAEDPDLSKVAPNTTKLVQALNARLNLAVQQVVGISGAALKKMFHDLRRKLARERKRLVILLEDITSAQGVDQELLYALQEESTTQPEFCDIVSLVGITPSYYRDHVASQANVKQRVTHHVQFGARAATGFYEIAGLRSEGEILSFAARYLRAVRAGTAEIAAAYADRRPVANRCERCDHRQACFGAFGQSGDVGLYPLTPKAVTRMYGSLEDPQHEMTLRTPRALIQGVLHPVFRAAPDLEAGRFPPASVEHDWLPDRSRAIQGLAQEIVEQQPSGVRERLRVVVSWWGDGRIPVEGDRKNTWAGVPHAVLETFGLPVPGGAPDVGGNGADGEEESPGAPPPIEPPPPLEPPPKKSKEVRELEERLARLARWTAEKRIDDDGYWAALAKRFIEAASWEHQDVERWFTTEQGLGQVQLEGAGRVDARNVVVPCEAWAQKGLEWAAKLDAKLVAPAEREHALRATALFARRLRGVVEEWVRDRTPTLSSGERWRFVSSAAQVLLVRAWLRGEGRPSDPFEKHIETILSGDGRAAPRRGAREWADAAERLAAAGSLRAKLRDAVRLGDGARAYGLVDLTELAAAVRSLTRDGQFAPAPASVPEQTAKTNWLRVLGDAAKLASAALPAVAAKEIARLEDRRRQVLDAAGAVGYVAHIQRARKAFDDFKEAIPTVAVNELRAALEKVDRGAALLAEKPGAPVLALREFLGDRVRRPKPGNVIAQFEFVAGAPNDELEYLCDLLDQVQRTIRALVEYLGPKEQELKKIPDAAPIHALGESLSKNAKALQEKLP